MERAEDVLLHKKLLHLAHDPVNRPAFDVRLVQVSLILLDCLILFSVVHISLISLVILRFFSCFVMTVSDLYYLYIDHV